MLQFLKTVLKLILLAAAVTVLIQNLLIFPGAPDSLLHPTDRLEVPREVERLSVTTEDGKKLDTWRLSARKDDSAEPRVALILHGNMGDLHKFFYVQQYLSDSGYASYDFDYRGYGRSSGWPTEHGLYLDADAIWQYIVQREKITPDKILIVGVSLGSGPATYLAEKHQPRALLLLAAYSSIPEIVRDRPILSLLSPFVWIRFPNAERISRLSNTCVVAAHGTKDRKILVEHTRRLEAAYRGRSGFHTIIDEDANHDNILPKAWPRIVQSLQDCATPE